MLVVCELWSIWVLLSKGVVDGLVQGTPHGDMIGEVCGQSAVEVG